MSTIDLTNPIFSDEEKARAHLEAQRWPDGVTCPFCGGLDGVKAAQERGARGPAGITATLAASCSPFASAPSWSAHISRSPSGRWPST